MVKYEYKNTGIEWLGEIPAHWKATPIKKEFKVIPSNVDKKSADDETEVKLCNYVDVYYNDFLDSTVDYMVATANDGEIQKFKLCVNDVLITKDSEDPYDISVPAVITEIQDNFLCGYHLSMIRSINQKISGKFLFWAIKDECNCFTIISRSNRSNTMGNSFTSY
jgi:type I restriction enzyme, S subunit